jgi:hypothetical protein
MKEIWDIVGDDYDAEGILAALDECEWHKEDTVNLLLSSSMSLLILIDRQS